MPARSHADRRLALGRLGMLVGAVLSTGRAVAQTPTTAPASSSSGAFGLPQLMQTLAQVKAGEATFRETRTVVMLEHTLESSGRLSFAAPDSFVRETLKPRRERVAVVGDTVTMSLGQRSRSVPLDSLPEAAVIIEAIRGTLTGNREAIERHFDAKVSGTAQRWSLELVPREARLREQVGSVRLSGRQAGVREMTVAMADGDRSVMTIEPLTIEPLPPAASAGSSAGPGAAR